MNSIYYDVLKPNYKHVNSKGNSIRLAIASLILFVSDISPLGYKPLSL